MLFRSFDSGRGGNTEEKAEPLPEKEIGDELRNSLLALDLDELSPKQAWEKLYKLQQQAKEE